MRRRPAVLLADGSHLDVVEDDAPSAARMWERWTLAATLSHPNLVRVLETGHAERVRYAVREAPDEVLANVLKDRPLTPDEAEQLLDSEPGLRERFEAWTAAHPELLDDPQAVLDFIFMSARRHAEPEHGRYPVLRLRELPSALLA